MQKIAHAISVLLVLVSCKTSQKVSPCNETGPNQTVVVQISPQVFIDELSDKLEENSGLVVYDGLFWSFNDSGGENVLFAFNKNGKIIHEIELQGAKNIDWEDIAQDEKHLYVGDFGNNNGTRKNQIIYTIKKKDLGKKKKQKVKVKEIKFGFANQRDFAFRQHNTAFDCEAMVAFNGKLYLFTKNWESRATTSYQLEKQKGPQEIQPRDTFDVGALITGADISPDKTKLALVGYKNYKPVLWLFTGFEDDDFFNGEKTYIEMDSILYAQTEGVAFKGNDSLLISCEQTPVFKQQVFIVGLTKID